MKKTFIQLPILLTLVIALIVGLSYLSLDRSASSAENDTESKDTSIALVNEDEGSSFDEQQLDFGDAFVQSLNQYENHEWFVVSRGTAESGLEDKTYDLMIVIPKDFTEKALSINSESPEQVLLNYKINATDSEATRAQAEEAASEILNDFNRRIIDVYFASILGNLQDAQDHVSQLVDEYENLTDSYHQNINHPISGYTNQFGQIQNNTQFSIDRFNGFENTLNSYEDLLVNQFDNFEDYQSKVNQVQESQAENQSLNENFNEQLRQFQNELSNDEVNENLQTLRNLNDYVNVQFIEYDQDELDPEKNIDYFSKLIDERLNTVLEQLEAGQNGINVDEIVGNVTEELTTIISDAFEGEDDEMTGLLSTQQGEIENRIETQIKKLPNLSIEDLKETKLSPNLKNEIQNVLTVTEKYKNEFNEDVAPESGAMTLSDQLEKLKQQLNKDGVLLEDTVDLPETEEPLENLSVYGIPDGFEVDSISVNGDELSCENLSGEEQGKSCEIPSFDEEKFTLAVKLVLKDEYVNEPIDLPTVTQFQWNLDLVQYEQVEQVSETSVSDETKVSGETTEGTTSSDSENKQVSKTKETIEDGSQVEQEQQNQTVDEEKKSTTEENGQQQTDEQNHEDNEQVESTDQNVDSEVTSEESGDSTSNETGEKSDNSTSNDSEPEIVEIEKNHHYSRQVTDAVIKENDINELLVSIENTIAPYQKLLSSYEMYFGFSLSCYEENCNVIDEESTLKGGTEDNDPEKLFKSGDGLITDDSLYAMFNKNVADLLTDHIVEQVIEDVEGGIEEPLQDYKNQMDEYKLFIEDTLVESEELASKIEHTKEAASELENQLDTTFENVDGWKSRSHDLIDSQSQIITTNNEEQQMVMSLEDGFQPLYSQSQTLAEQASDNLNEAEGVYDTLDQVDEQASDVQQSGANLVQQAEGLATDFTNKLVSDQNFAENFSDVMANSRVGERQNEDLYDFLSNPVEKENDGVILGTSTTTFTPYFIILIAFFVALFTGYGISNLNEKRREDNQFKQEQSLVGGNFFITGMTAIIAVVEGLVLGIVSGMLLEIGGSKLILWTAVMLVLMLMMGLAAAYLLRQLKMIGMFILLAVASLYLMLNDSISSTATTLSGWQVYSPLHYVERMLSDIVLENGNYGWIVLAIIVLAVVGFIGNLLVIHRYAAKTEDENDVA